MVLNKNESDLKIIDLMLEGTDKDIKKLLDERERLIKLRGEKLVAILDEKFPKE